MKKKSFGDLICRGNPVLIKTTYLHYLTDHAATACAPVSSPAFLSHPMCFSSPRGDGQVVARREEYIVLLTQQRKHQGPDAREAPRCGH
jgi:hypothetical protein